MKILKDSTKGLIVISDREYSKGEIVIESHRCSKDNKRSKYSIERYGEHIEIDKPGKLTSHSCCPNCTLVPNDHGAFNFLALDSIAMGDEITIDYEKTESNVISFSQCKCGSNNCRETITGNSTLKQPIGLRGYSFPKDTAVKYCADGKLLAIRLETNSECNLACNYCYSLYDRQGAQNMKLSQAKYVIDQAQDLGCQSVIHLGGGEPLLYEDFWPLVEYMKLKTMIPVIFSNTVLMTKDSAKRLYDLDASVIGKYDACSKESQEFLTGPNTFHKIQDGLMNLMDAGFNMLDEHRYSRLGVGICTVNQTVDDAIDIWRFCRDNDIFPNLEPVSVMGKAGNELNLRNDKKTWLRNTIQDIDRHDYSIKWNSPVYTPIFGHDCWVSATSCTVSMNGDVGLCAGSPPSANSNIFKVPLKDILHDPFFDRARNICETIEEPCKSCEYLEFCRGGCRSRACFEGANEYSCDPCCPKVEAWQNND